MTSYSLSILELNLIPLNLTFPETLVHFVGIGVGAHNVALNMPVEILCRGKGHLAILPHALEGLWDLWDHVAS